MKLNKKIICLAAAATMLTSAVASAATLPIPADNNEAFANAESFYYDGLYYEALGELNYVDANGAFYDANKYAAWVNKINYAISRMEIENLLESVRTLYSAGMYYEALQGIDALNARTDITMTDYYSIRYWEDVVINKIWEMLSVKVDAVRTGEAAVNRVKDAGYTLASEYEWYTNYAIDGGFVVNIKTQLPGGGSQDVAGFVVTTDGTVTRTF